MLSKLVTAAIVAAVGVIVISSLPDIKRYFEILDMKAGGECTNTAWPMAWGARCASAPAAARSPGSASGSA